MIAEIITRYFPHKLSMHSFDNSENEAKKNNNWFLLKKFFQKNDYPFREEEFKEIKNGNFEQLVSFMIKFYQLLAKRTYSYMTQCYPKSVRSGQSCPAASA